MTDAAYDAIAAWYANRVREGGAGDWAFPALLDLLGDIRSQHICDLGCGEGRVARLLAQRDAHVAGIDLLSELIEAARREEAAHPLGIRYRVDDAESLGTIPDADFDGVVCCLALMDIPRLDATLHAVSRVLEPGGWFAFLITHPCFAAPHARLRMEPDGAASWEIRGYFAEGFWRSDDSGNLCARWCAASDAIHVPECARVFRLQHHPRRRTAADRPCVRAKHRLYRGSAAPSGAVYQGGRRRLAVERLWDVAVPQVARCALRARLCGTVVRYHGMGMCAPAATGQGMWYGRSGTGASAERRRSLEKRSKGRRRAGARGCNHFRGRWDFSAQQL